MNTSEKILKDAIQYVRDNKTWDEGEEQHAWNLIGLKMPIPCYITDAIHDLMEEFSEAEEIPEGWWLEYMDEDDIFRAL